MSRHDGPVLADTNVILECWRVSAWQALASGYRVETVEDCVIETQTGFQRRRARQQIDKGRLLSSLAAVHFVGDRELAAAAARSAGLVAGHRRAFALGACTDTRRRLGVVRPG